MLFHKTMKFATLASAMLALSMFASAFTIAHAYGPAQWQAGFSGNFTNPTTGQRGGFWGWCDFAGSASDGLSGTSADCELAAYMFNGAGANNGGLFQASIQGTAWNVQPTTMGPPGNDFFVTSGTATVTGPLVVTVLKSGAPVPPGCTVSGDTATCPLSFWASIGLITPDTGIPAMPGHFSLANIAEILGIEIPPGTHIDVQVTQIS
jgi:hypothetical protein